MKYIDFKPGDWGYRIDEDEDIHIFRVKAVNSESVEVDLGWFKNNCHNWTEYLVNRANPTYLELRLATTEEILSVYPEYETSNYEIY